jgi:SAM-dependent methyltransferase
MHECDPHDEPRAQLQEWYETSLGRSLQAMERHRLREVLPGLFGPTAVQLGRASRMDMLEASIAATRIVLEELPASDAAGPWVRARVDACPFRASSVHMVLLHHTLEFADDPHQVLREARRILQPEGHVVILGFNPYSAWGVWRLVGRCRGRVPWCGRFLSLPRIKDWLGLLDFEVVGGSMLYYRPPAGGEALRDRLHFLESVGDRWWPLLAAVYIVIARKRDIGVTPLQPEWKTKRALAPGLVKPLARNVSRANG